MRLTWILPALLAACPGPAGDTDAAPLIAWEPVLQADARGAFLMAWADGSGDVWVVGGQPETGIVLRGTASNLAEVPLPEGTPLLNWVHGTGPDDVWVGGLNGTVLHWDGAAWSDRSLEMEEAVWGLYAMGPGDVWAVGGTSAWGGQTARIRHRTGETWDDVALPDVLTDLGNLFKVHHDGTTLWSCGFAGSVVRSDDGSTLTAVPTGYAGDIVTVHGQPGQDPVFVGGRGTGAILEVDGDAVSVVETARAGLSGVHVLPDGRAIVVGERGLAGVYDTASDTLTEAPVPTEDVLHGVVVDGEGRVWAAGGNLYTAGDAFEGSLWSGTLMDGGEQ